MQPYHQRSPILSPRGSSRGNRFKRTPVVRRRFVLGLAAAGAAWFFLHGEPERTAPPVKRVEQPVLVQRSPLAALGGELKQKMSEARRTLNAEWYAGKQKYPCEEKKDGSETVWVAAFNLKSHKIEAIRLTKTTGNGAKIRDSTGRFSVELVKDNGLNSEYEIVHPPDYVPLALKMGFRMTIKEGSVERVVAVYTPFDESLTENRELLLAGMSYLEQLVRRARESLMSVDSGDVIAKVNKISGHVALLMVLNEHVDPYVFEKEGVECQVDKELALLGANEEKAYNYGVSRGAGARGLCQLIRSTYKSLYGRYRKAVGLNPDFYAGTSDHLNAVKFQFLLHADDLHTLLLHQKVKGTKYVDLDNERDVVTKLAAAYNAGVDDVIRAVNGFGENWSTPPRELVDARKALQDEAKTLQKLMRNPTAQGDNGNIFDYYKQLREGYARRLPSSKAVKRFNAEFPPHANHATARKMLARRLKEAEAELKGKRFKGVLPDETITYVRKVEALMAHVETLTLGR